MILYYNPVLDILGILQDDELLLKVSEDNIFMVLNDYEWWLV